MLKKVMKALLVSGIYFGWAILFYCLREGALAFAWVNMGKRLELDDAVS